MNKAYYINDSTDRCRATIKNGKQCSIKKIKEDGLCLVHCRIKNYDSKESHDQYIKYCKDHFINDGMDESIDIHLQIIQNNIIQNNYYIQNNNTINVFKTKKIILINRNRRLYCKKFIRKNPRKLTRKNIKTLVLYKSNLDKTICRQKKERFNKFLLNRN